MKPLSPNIYLKAAELIDMKDSKEICSYFACYGLNHALNENIGDSNSYSELMHKLFKDKAEYGPAYFSEGSPPVIERNEHRIIALILLSEIVRTTPKKELENW